MAGLGGPIPHYWPQGMVGYDESLPTYTTDLAAAEEAFREAGYWDDGFTMTVLAEEGGIFEIAPAREALMGEIASRIARHGGAGIFFDYGHLAPGLGDTFQAVRNHRSEGVLDNPGEADLTSHVDFSALAAVARAHGVAPAE